MSDRTISIIAAVLTEAAGLLSLVMFLGMLAVWSHIIARAI